jgi:hypothetical protein
MKYILPVIAVLALFAAPVLAHEPPPPQPSDTIEMPVAVNVTIDEARRMCEPQLGAFSFGVEFMREAELNGDESPDYVVSSAGFICEGAASLYGGSAGDTHYVYLSGKNGHVDIDKGASGITAYGFAIDDTVKPAQIVYDMRCPDGDGMKTGKQRWGLKKDHMAVISMTGCE